MHQVLIILVDGNNLRFVHGLDDLAPPIPAFDGICSLSLSINLVGLKPWRLLIDTILVSAGWNKAPLGIRKSRVGPSGDALHYLYVSGHVRRRFLVSKIEVWDL